MLQAVVYDSSGVTLPQRADLAQAATDFGTLTPTREELTHIATVYRLRQLRATDGARPLKATTLAKLYGQPEYMPQRARASPTPESEVTDDEFFGIIAASKE